MALTFSMRASSEVMAPGASLTIDCCSAATWASVLRSNHAPLTDSPSPTTSAVTASAMPNEPGSERHAKEATPSSAMPV